MENSSIQLIREKFSKYKKAVIAGHVSPDGDCIGSCLALYHYLRHNFQIEADVYMDEFPDAFMMLPGADKINTGSPDTEYDIFFALDCSDEERIGNGSQFMKTAKEIICIDHHISNSGYGAANYIVPDASSTCEVLYELFNEDGIDENTAICLYTGMVHDTGIFQYSNVSEKTLTRAAKLISFGFDFPELIAKTYFEKDLNETKGFGYALSKAEYICGGKGVWSFLDLDEMNRYELKPGKIEGVASNLRNVKGVDFSVFLYAAEEGVYRASFRSNGVVDVSALACSFGGGGHVRASGCTFFNLGPQEIIRMVEDYIEKH